MAISGSSTIHTVGPATFGSTFASSGSVTCSALLARNAGGTISGSNTLQIVGAATFSSTIAATGSITATGVTSYGGVTVTTGFYSGSGDFHTDGHVTLGGDMTATGSVTANGVTSTGGVTTNGVTSTAAISGSNTLHNVGVATFGNNVAATGSVSANGLTSTGPATLNSISASSTLHSVGVATFGNSIAATGSITSGGSFVIGSADINETDLEKIDGITDGAGAANKALVLNGSADVASGLRSVTGSGDAKFANIHATQLYGGGAGLTGVTATVTSLSGTTAQLTTGVETSGYLKVTGSTTLVGGLGAQAITATTYSGSGGMQVVGATILGNNLTVSGTTAIGGLLAQGVEVTTYSGSNTLHSVGVATFSSTIASTGSITGNGLVSTADLEVGGGDIAYGPGQNATLKISDASGTNIAGRDLTISAGNGTGTGAPGIMTLSVPKPGTSGGTVHTSVTIIQCMPEGPNFHWDQATAMANDTGLGDIIYMGTGTTTAGKMYYLNSGSAWADASCTIAASGGIGLLGIAIGSNPAVNGMLIRGFYDVHSYLSGTFTVGQPLYVTGAPPAAGGKVGVNKPSGSAEIVRVVGYCSTTANVIYFNPSSDYIELV